MGFAERAVAACDKAMSNGTLKERHVRDILKSRNPDVTPLVRHLASENSFVRRAVVRIVGGVGNDASIKQCVQGAKQEEDPEVLRALLQSIGKRGGEAVRVLERMVNSEDPFVREEAISMLKRTGQAESLLPLLFDKDDSLVKRVKRYIHEQKREQGTAEDPIS